jgi:SAM-dependent methyltransferase
MPLVDFPWPPLDGVSPVWTGAGFRIGHVSTPVLNYGTGPSGWSESLTDLHEDAAGEGVHPIDVASRRQARAALARHMRVQPSQAVLLEAGCSSGYLLRELLQDWPESLVIGSDFIEGPLLRLAAGLPQLPLLRFDLVHCPLPDASVDAVVLLNVLEHIENDLAALTQVFRILKPGGVAVIEVPAGPELYDAYDKHLQHFRRYRLRDLCELIQRTGFTVVERSHLGCFVYPAFAFVKRRNRRLLNAPADVRQQLVAKNIRASGRAGGGALGTIMAAECWLGRWVRYPTGIRCIVTATKSPH